MNEEERQQAIISSIVMRQWKIGKSAFDYTHHTGQHCCPLQGTRVITKKLLDSVNSGISESSAQRFNYSLITYLALKALNKHNHPPLPYSTNIENCINSINRLYSSLYHRIATIFGAQGLVLYLDMCIDKLTEIAEGKNLPLTEEVRELWVHVLLTSVTCEMLITHEMSENSQKTRSARVNA